MNTIFPDNWGIFGKLSAASDYEIMSSHQPISSDVTLRIARQVNCFQQSQAEAVALAWPDRTFIWLSYFYQENILDHAGRPVTRVILHQVRKENLTPVYVLSLLAFLIKMQPQNPLQALSLQPESKEALQVIPPTLKQNIIHHYLLEQKSCSLSMVEAIEAFGGFQNWYPDWIVLPASSGQSQSEQPTSFFWREKGARGLILLSESLSEQRTHHQTDAPYALNEGSKLTDSMLEDLLLANLEPRYNRQILDFIFEVQPSAPPNEACFFYLQGHHTLYNRLLQASAAQIPLENQFWQSALNADDHFVWTIFMTSPYVLTPKQGNRIMDLINLLPGAALKRLLTPDMWVWLCLHGYAPANQFLSQSFPWLASFLPDAHLPLSLPPEHWEAWANPLVLRATTRNNFWDRFQPPLNLIKLNWLAEYLNDGVAEGLDQVLHAELAELIDAMSFKKPLPSHWLQQHAGLLSREDLLLQWALYFPDSCSADWFIHAPVLKDSEKQWLLEPDVFCSLECPQWTETELILLYCELSRCHLLQLLAHYAQQPESFFRSKVLFFITKHAKFSKPEQKWLFQRFLSLQPISEIPSFSLSERLCLWPYLDLEREILRPLFQEEPKWQTQPELILQLIHILRQEGMPPPPSPPEAVCLRERDLIMVLKTLPGWHAFGDYQFEPTKLDNAWLSFSKETQALFFKQASIEEQES